ncbi:MAG: transcription termination/antitermination factor NusG [Oscillospiraceae bacterium]|nr:transcription termination/antitermination factor NusG [Oscillospiraceae bacterium]
MADSAPRWYVVHTYSGYENKVATNIKKAVENRNLQELIYEVRVPTETVVEHKENGTVAEVERKLFPGYVLVKMIVTDESWYIVRNTRGVTGFVGPSGEPIPLSAAEVAALGVEKKTVEIQIGKGDSIKITDGPFAGFIGTVEEVDTDNVRLKATISMFGRDTSVELEVNQVEVLN